MVPMIPGDTAFGRTLEKKEQQQRYKLLIDTGDVQIFNSVA